MPTYAYVCTECAHSFDIVQAITDDALTQCPLCGGQLRKKFHPVGVTFKGSGFYRTDSRQGSSGSADGASGAGTKTESGSSNGSSATSSDSKGSDSKKSDSKSSSSGTSSSSGSSGSTKPASTSSSGS